MTDERLHRLFVMANETVAIHMPADDSLDELVRNVDELDKEVGDDGFRNPMFVGKPDGQ